MSVRGYQLGIDFSGAGDFSGPYDDVSSWLSGDDLTIEVGRDTSQAAASIPTGTLGFHLQEIASSPAQRVFTPETGPLDGQILPGIAAQFSATDGTGTNRVLFTGTFDTFDYDDEAQTLTGQLRDSWGVPAGEKLSTTVYQGMRTGDLIGVVLDAIGWPAAARDIDPGDTVIAFWWEEGTDAATAIQKLVDSEGPPAIGYVYAGTFVFRDRHHRSFDTASNTSQATYSIRFPAGSGSPTEIKIADGGFVYNHGRSNIVNTATFQVDQLVAGAPAAVWSNQAPLSVAAGQTVTFTVNGNNAFVQALTPVAATAFDDNGAPTNGDYALAYGSIASIAISRDSGASLTLTIVGGGTDALFSYLQVTANPIVSAQTVTVTSQDTASVGAKGVLTWPGSLPWCNQYDAQAIADIIVARYAHARVIVTITIDADIAPAYATEFATRMISDRITVINDRLGVSGDFHIERARRIVRALGLHGAQLELTCEAAITDGAANPFQFDVAGHGFDQGQFDVNGIDNASTVMRFDVAGHGFDQGRFGT